MSFNRSVMMQTLKVVITAGLLAWLGMLLHRSDVLPLLLGVDKSLFVAACIAHLVAYLFLFVRWRNILAIYYRLPYSKLLDSYYIGLFSNNFIPSTIGGDVVRATYLYRQGLLFWRLLVCAITDRLLGLASVILLAVISLLVFPVKSLVVDINSNIYLWGLLMIFSAAGLFSLFLRLETDRFGWNDFKTRLVFGFSSRLEQLIVTATGQGKRLLLGLALSLAGTSCVILCYYLLAQALEISVPLAALFVVIPLSYFAAALPISVGGLGVREGSIVFLLTLFKVPVEEGLALTAAYLVVLILVSAPGGFWILGKPRPALVDDAGQ